MACHTVTHPTVARCPLPEVAREVLDDRQALEALTGTPVRGLSYPNDSASPSPLQAARRSRYDQEGLGLI